MAIVLVKWNRGSYNSVLMEYKGLLDHPTTNNTPYATVYKAISILHRLFSPELAGFHLGFFVWEGGGEDCAKINCV